MFVHEAQHRCVMITKPSAQRFATHRRGPRARTRSASSIALSLPSRPRHGVGAQPVCELLESGRERAEHPKFRGSTSTRRGRRSHARDNFVLPDVQAGTSLAHDLHVHTSVVSTSSRETGPEGPSDHRSCKSCTKQHVVVPKGPLASIYGTGRDGHVSTNADRAQPNPPQDSHHVVVPRQRHGIYGENLTSADTDRPPRRVRTPPTHSPSFLRGHECHAGHGQAVASGAEPAHVGLVVCAWCGHRPTQSQRRC